MELSFGFGLDALGSINWPVALACAYLLDQLLGEPPNAAHPVAWLGRAVALADAWASRGGARAQFFSGLLLTAVASLAFVAPGVASVSLLERHVSSLLASLAAIAWLKITFSASALGQAGTRVREALEAGDLRAARHGLGALCSRNPDALEAPELAAASVESLAENTSDSVVAPLFWLALGGLPGALAYRAVNTLDAMFGYRGRYEYFGKAAARLDDLLNFVPARITALLLICAGACVGADAGGGWRMARRDASKATSPNAGWPMATMAGLLGLRLTKPGVYALGDASRPIEAADISRAWRICRLAMALWVGLVLWWLSWRGA